MFLFRNLIGNFREMVKFRLLFDAKKLKYRHIIFHFEAGNIENQNMHYWPKLIGHYVINS